MSDEKRNHNGAPMGLKALIVHYETMLEEGRIKHNGPAHERLLELKQKLKDKYLDSWLKNRK